MGRQAQALGRKKILLMGFAAPPIRGVLLAFVSNPYVLVVVQVLDGVSAAVLGVDHSRCDARNRSLQLSPRRDRHRVGIGASVSGVLTGYAADLFGSTVAFLMLAAVGAVGLMAVWAPMPETRALAMKPWRRPNKRW